MNLEPNKLWVFLTVLGPNDFLRERWHVFTDKTGNIKPCTLKLSRPGKTYHIQYHEDGSIVQSPEAIDLAFNNRQVYVALVQFTDIFYGFVRQGTTP